MWPRVSFSFRTALTSYSYSKVTHHGVDLGVIHSGQLNLRFLSLNIERCDAPQPQTKVLKVALIGRPNAGKSTLINQIVGKSSCPVSMKAHTTRVKLRAFLNDGDTQLIFLDTPGLVFAEEVKRFKFDPTFLRSAEEAVREADILGVLHDSSFLKRNALDPCTVRLLLLYQHKKSFLILNKVDVTKNKGSLLQLTQSLTLKPKQPILDSTNMSEPQVSKLTQEISSWPYFDQVFMVSALAGDGVGDVKEYLLQEAHPGPWLVVDNKVSNYYSLAVDFVKAACLDFLPEEVPYRLQYKLLYFEDGEDQCAIEVAVKPLNRRHQKMVLDKIRSIAAFAESHLASALGKECRLRVQVVILEGDKS